MFVTSGPNHLWHAWLVFRAFVTLPNLLTHKAMADNKPTENLKTYEDPFSDHPRHPRFLEPTSPRPYESTTSLSFAEDSLHDPYDEDEYVEKQPLNSAQGFSGGFYPPPWVGFWPAIVHKMLTERSTLFPFTFQVYWSFNVWCTW